MRACGNFGRTSAPRLKLRLARSSTILQLRTVANVTSFGEDKELNAGK
jgi:hypothetical protein